jgi:putative transposase
MTAPYSMDLRERALARKAAGETHREIAAGLQIAPSCVSKWMRRERETGSAAPAQVGGYKPRTLSGEIAEWLRRRIEAGPFTLRGLTAELAARGVKTQPRAVWVFVHAEGLSFKKNPAAGGADAAGRGPPQDPLADAPGTDRGLAPGVHR